MHKSGKFITFEGGDGAGKTTLIASVEAHLKSLGHQVVVTRAPGGTDLGEEIRSLLLEAREVKIDRKAELFLFLADRAQHVEEVIFPALLQSKVVLCDRYNDSTVAYQSSARGLSRDEVEKLCQFATNGLNPDLTLYLDLDPQIGMQRVSCEKSEKDRIESENLTFHQLIRKAYIEIAQKEPKRFKLINASQSKDEVYKEALRNLHALF